MKLLVFLSFPTGSALEKVNSSKATVTLALTQRAKTEVLQREDTGQPRTIGAGEGVAVAYDFSGYLGTGYPLVNKHSYGKWPFIVDVPIENGDFL